ncbi:hypothetical protein [Polaribacter porphyrae]|uniref:DUF5362 domain-containing protein n=1 Tax=Polaribacter porphyrae TaxID=1137780 RepID=A0A2S7WTG2_9FLAO|nr:hypothetical protein [Polaribacter porphyrae]PQJ80864.1 hypothetical protein BTO18_01510 [Polaribacter porphyrae]
MHNPITQLEELTLTTASKRFLKETAKWTFFLSILGFIGVFLMLVMAFFTPSIFEMMVQMQPSLPPNMGSAIAFTYFVLAILYFFPVYYLIKFSIKLKKALSTKNDETLAKAFEMLKSHYKFIGVFSIITLSIYLVLIVFSAMGFLS